MTQDAGLNLGGAVHDDPHGQAARETNDAGSEMPDLRKLAQDWITLWQTELAALATDREMQETWQATMALWGNLATAMLNGVRPAASKPHARHDGDAARAARDDAPGPAPVAAAPDARDAEIERLSRHVAALEARLEQLERGRLPRRTAKRKR